MNRSEYQAFSRLLRDQLAATTPGLLPFVSRLLAVYEAADRMDLFVVALVENEGPGFSCTEIEEIATLWEALGNDATDIRRGHAYGDEDGDMEEHLELVR